MASNKYLELQEFSDAELVDLKTDRELAYQKLKFDHAVSGLDNPLDLREKRRNLARIKTEIRRREVANMSEDQLANRSKLRFRRRNK